MIRPRRPETDKLIELLRETSPGQIVTYRAMSVAAGIEVQQTDQRGCMATARRVLSREEGIEFSVEHNVGLRRMQIEDFPGMVRGGIKKIRRQGQRTSRRLANAPKVSNDIPAEVMRDLTAQSGVLGVIDMMTRKSTLTKIRDQPSPETGSLPPRDVLGLFARKRAR